MKGHCIIFHADQHSEVTSVQLCKSSMMLYTVGDRDPLPPPTFLMSMPVCGNIWCIYFVYFLLTVDHQSCITR